MNVDKHDFDIEERRKVHRERAASASQKGLATYRSQKSLKPASSTRNYPLAQQTLPGLGRPISGLLPQTISQKTLGHTPMQGPQHNVLLQQHNPAEKSKATRKDFKISKRPFSANPKYMQLSGLNNRPLSAIVQMGDRQGG